MRLFRYSIRVGIHKPKKKEKTKKSKDRSFVGKSQPKEPESAQYRWICSTPIIAGQESIMVVVEGRINYTRDAYAQMLVEVWVSDDVSGNPMQYGMYSFPVYTALEKLVCSKAVRVCLELLYSQSPERGFPLLPERLAPS